MNKEERPACEHCSRDFKQYGTVRGLTTYPHSQAFCQGQGYSQLVPDRKPGSKAVYSLSSLCMQYISVFSTFLHSRTFVPPATSSQHLTEQNAQGTLVSVPLLLDPPPPPPPLVRSACTTCRGPYLRILLT